MPKSVKLSASSTIQRERPMGGWPDGRVELIEIDLLRYCRAKRRITPSIIQTKSQLCWRIPSIDFGGDSSILA
jgi:hypothetical protein